MVHQRWLALAPSMRAASSSSGGIVERAAEMLKTTRGTACQRTSRPATRKVERPVENHEWPTVSKPTRDSSQLTTPKSVSKSHWKTVVAARTGVAHASTRLTESRTFGTRGSRTSSNAIRTPTTMVAVAQAAVKSTERTTASQKAGSARMVR